MGAGSQPIIVDDLELGLGAAPRAEKRNLTFRVSENIEDVEPAWRQLSADAVESPGQSYDFIRLWTRYRQIPASEQRYVVAELDGTPLAILPLHLKRLRDVRVLTWFPGTHAGCYAPIADLDRLAALGPEGRAELWRGMIAQCRGADLVLLRTVPVEIDGRPGLFDQLGTTVTTDTLYRAQFSSWESCDREQRSRTRRKHDRQQGDRLAALGTVAFEEITDPDEAQAAIGVMFRQRSERFRAQGIRDCFVVDGLTGFYHEAARPGSGVDVRLHVLRLDGEIVAVRYNVVQGDRMFCLISSMTEDPALQAGSPGKQCLLRVMQTVFDQGVTVFDMGAGFSDEKRHWCNVQIALRHHYVPLTPFGFLASMAHGSLQRFRAWAKHNPRVRAGVRAWSHWRGRIKPSSDQP